MGHLRSFRGTGRILGESSFLTRRVASAALKTSMVGMMVFLLTFVFLPSITSAANAASDTLVAANISWQPISMTFTDGGNIDFGSITPQSASGSTYGTMKVMRKTLVATTNGRALDVYVSMNGTTDKLFYGSDDSSSLYIPSSAGTWASPAAFSGIGWGYAVPQKTVNSSVINGSGNAAESHFADADAFITSFGLNNGTNSQLSDEIKSGTGYNEQTWAGVPIKTAPQKIWSQTAASESGFGTGADTDRGNFDIYYAVMVDTSLVSGTYGNSVIYTALASTDSLAGVSNNIRVTNTSSTGRTNLAKRYTANGDSLKLEFDMNQSDGTVNAGNTTIYLVPHSEVGISGTGSSATYSVSNTMTANMGTYPTCASPTFSTVSSGMEIVCTVSGAGLVTKEGSEKEKSNGYYDIWVHNEQYHIDYLSKYLIGSDLAATLAFVGLQSVDSSENRLITEMQDMTSSVCKNSNKWTSDVGTAARVKDSSGNTPRTKGNDSTGAEIGDTLAASNALGIGTFDLTDNRDSKKYLVRRLADGNCWMVQNLALELGDFAGKNDINGGLTPDNTDLTSATATARGYWDPAESTATKYNTTYADALTTAGLTRDFDGLATYLLGTSVTQYQFQTYDKYGNNYFWGSRKNEDGETIVSVDSTNAAASNKSSGNNSATHQGSGVWIENNSRSEIPRSYSNNVTGGADQGYRYVPTNQETGATTSYGTNNATAVTGTFSPTGTVDSGNAVGYYGNMYIGNYYNWYAATAESGKYSQASVSAKTEDDSICPAGWQLPTDGNSDTDKSWAKLLKNTTNGYGLFTTDGTQSASTNPFGDATSPSLKMHQAPLSIIFSGNYYWVSGNLGSRGSYGFYWSSTPSSSVYARSLGFSSTSVGPQYNGNKPYGFTVRCVAR